MAEAPTTEAVDYYVDTIAAVVKDEIGIQIIQQKIWKYDTMSK